MCFLVVFLAVITRKKDGFTTSTLLGALHKRRLQKDIQIMASHKDFQISIKNYKGFMWMDSNDAMPKYVGSFLY